MITQLEALQTLLEDAVADASCAVAGVVLTAGRPAAPSGEGQDCQTVIYLWGQRVADETQTSADACTVRSRWAMQYEIWTCYPESWDGSTDTEQATAAACLYELISLVWCALVEAKDTNYFCDCKFVELEPLETQPRGGGAVSALGGVTLPYTCPPAESSPSSP
jgi:hypothetical protein